MAVFSKVQIGAYTEIPLNYTDEELQKAKRAVVTALMEDVINAGCFIIKELDGFPYIVDCAGKCVTVGFKMPITVWADKEADVKFKLYEGVEGNKISCD